MRIATVESATLATVGYDESQEQLQLEFCSRAVYLYFGVPRRFTKPCSARLPKAGISIRPSAGSFHSVLSGVSKQLRRMRKCTAGTIIRRTHGAHSGGVAGWQPDH